MDDMFFSFEILKSMESTYLREGYENPEKRIQEDLDSLQKYVRMQGVGWSNERLETGMSFEAFFLSLPMLYWNSPDTLLEDKNITDIFKDKFIVPLKEYIQGFKYRSHKFYQVEDFETASFAFKVSSGGEMGGILNGDFVEITLLTENPVQHEDMYELRDILDSIQDRNRNYDEVTQDRLERVSMEVIIPYFEHHTDSNILGLNIRPTSLNFNVIGEWYDTFIEREYSYRWRKTEWEK